MTTIKIPHWLGYVLWIVVGCCLVWVGWIQPESVRPISSLSLVEQPRYCLTDTAGRSWMLSLQPITRLTQTPAGIQVGEVSLPISQTLIGNERYWLPVVSADWQEVMASLLGGKQTDSTRRWQTARRQWRQFVKPVTDAFARTPGRPVLTEEQLLTHALVQRLNQLPGHAAYGLDSALHALTGVESVSVQVASQIRVRTQPEPTSTSSTRRFIVGLGFLMVLAGLLLTYFSRKPSGEPDISETASEPTEPEQPQDAPAQLQMTSLTDEAVIEPAVPDDTLLSRYLHQFYERYGDFYQYLQDIPIEPDESQKQEVRRRIVEMALHAHSLCRAYKLNPSLDRITDEPNLQLIWQNANVQALAEGVYKPFDLGAYSFSKKHQFLQQILQEMNLNHLNGALVQTIYIPPAYL